MIGEFFLKKTGCFLKNPRLIFPPFLSLINERWCFILFIPIGFGFGFRFSLQVDWGSEWK